MGRFTVPQSLDIFGRVVGDDGTHMQSAGIFGALILVDDGKDTNYAGNPPQHLRRNMKENIEEADWDRLLTAVSQSSTSF